MPTARRKPKRTAPAPVAKASVNLLIVGLAALGLLACTAWGVWIVLNLPVVLPEPVAYLLILTLPFGLLLCLWSVVGRVIGWWRRRK